MSKTKVFRRGDQWRRVSADGEWARIKPKTGKTIIPEYCESLRSMVAFIADADEVPEDEWPWTWPRYAWVCGVARTIDALRMFANAKTPARGFDSSGHPGPCNALVKLYGNPSYEPADREEAERIIAEARAAAETPKALPDEPTPENPWWYRRAKPFTKSEGCDPCAFVRRDTLDLSGCDYDEDGVPFGIHVHPMLDNLYVWARLIGKPDVVKQHEAQNETHASEGGELEQLRAKLARRNVHIEKLQATCGRKSGEINELKALLDARIGYRVYQSASHEVIAWREKCGKLADENADLREQLKVPNPARDVVNECNKSLAAQARRTEKLREQLAALEREREVICMILYGRNIPTADVVGDVRAINDQRYDAEKKLAVCAGIDPERAREAIRAWKVMVQRKLGLSYGAKRLGWYALLIDTGCCVSGIDEHGMMIRYPTPLAAVLAAETQLAAQQPPEPDHA